MYKTSGIYLTIYSWLCRSRRQKAEWLSEDVSVAWGWEWEWNVLFSSDTWVNLNHPLQSGCLKREIIIHLLYFCLLCMYKKSGIYLTICSWPPRLVDKRRKWLSEDVSVAVFLGWCRRRHERGSSSSTFGTGNQQLAVISILSRSASLRHTHSLTHSGVLRWSRDECFQWPTQGHSGAYMISQSPAQERSIGFLLMSPPDIIYPLQ